MNLPNYFLADLPAEASVSPQMLTEACQTLRRNRERYIGRRSTPAMVTLLSQVAAEWLKPAYPLRKLALERSAEAGFSPATLARGLDDFFRQLTPANFEALLDQELGDRNRLDKLIAAPPEQATGRAGLVTAPEFLVQIAAGNLPSPTLMSIALGVLLRSAQLVKCASGTSLIPRLFAHSLYEADSKVGACLEVAEWRGGSAELEQVVFEQADCVTATGTDATLAAIRQKLPARTRFVGYGHRLSFAFVAAEGLSGLNVDRLAAAAALDVTAWDQLGCLSPHVIYVETGGAASPAGFAEVLAEHLEQAQTTVPRAELATPIAAAISSRRAIYEMRAAQSEDTRIWASPGSTAWTVVYEADPRFQVSCLHRFIYVKPVGDLDEMLRAADEVRTKVSTIGLGAASHRIEEFALKLGRWGAARLCPLGQMQRPPLAWRHDGRPVLADLVAWTDLEMPA